MLKRVAKRLVEMREGFKNHMHPMGEIMQRYHATILADAIVCRAQRRVQRTGQVLYAFLPHDMAQLVCKTDFDPYNRHPSEWEIQQWLLDHVIFSDSGDIIALIDGGEIVSMRLNHLGDIDYYFYMRGTNNNG
jgi:hypothetical protein